ncbi:kynureninase [Marinovum sp. 2_MG-2023]|uniref:kynureninase n=1 Tax=unclassified Marinovum TaxID=2647166 RepID=UPI0026E4897E|nr:MULTISPECIES: kynureninase [unclassified Marinovum]MDO6730116.1 kynureninase [Marinovum sp. 2_MG-2023]MDO6778854.1 kynureninase [Marinovum sp. 1_MG-2023]
MTDFTKTRAMFHLPDGMIYLDGNSLGPLPRAAAARLQQAAVDEWGDMLITGWNRAGWMGMPTRLGDRIGALIGAAPGNTVLGDTLSIKVYQALAAALEMRPDRRVVLSDSGNFPTDLYMAQGLLGSLNRGHELRVVAPEAVEAAIGEDIAVLMLTHVDYATGRMHDMARLTKRAQDAGAVVIWDLAHSAGAVPVDFAGSHAEFAVGCTYKYLNGGPGAPAFISLRPDTTAQVRPALAGWLGHDAPFAFEPDYRPGSGVARMRVGTPPVLQMAALDAALDVWDDVKMADIRAQSVALCDRFISGVEASCPDLTLASPRDADQRGSQVSFRFDAGYAAMQALIARGVIGDFRASNIMRFGFTPLYIGVDDVDRAVEILAEIMTTGAWDQPEYHQRNAVT